MANLRTGPTTELVIDTNGLAAGVTTFHGNEARLLKPVKQHVPAAAPDTATVVGHAVMRRRVEAPDP